MCREPGFNKKREEQNALSFVDVTLSLTLSLPQQYLDALYKHHHSISHPCHTQQEEKEQEFLCFPYFLPLPRQYLGALYKHRRNLSRRYHTKLVTLYANWDHKKLLPLLQHSSSYDLEAVLKMCQERCLTEMIHLLGM